MRGVKTTEDIPQNMFVAEYEANVLTPEQALQMEERYQIEGENLYILEASYNGRRVIFDATYRSDSIGRLINHSKKDANILLRKPIDRREKLRIGFIAKRNIVKGEELLFDYNLASYSKNELPAWYIRGRPPSTAMEDSLLLPEGSKKDTPQSPETSNPQPAIAPTSGTSKEDTPEPPKAETSRENTSQHGVRQLKKCNVPGCGATVRKMWNHIHSSAHRDLTCEFEVIGGVLS